MGYLFKLNSFLFKQFQPKRYKLRSFYAVHHNEKRGTFYIKLDDTAKAVLQYQVAGKILDLQSITVPSEYKGQGLARLLAEAALTYAIVNNYYLYLTCEYLQHYYFTVKNFELEERVIGPTHLFDTSKKPARDPEIEYELPHPEDFWN